MTRAHSTAILSEMARIESIIAEHGPCTVLGLSKEMALSKEAVIRRIEYLRTDGRVHIVYRKADPLNKSPGVSAFYGIGPQRGPVPHQPTVKAWTRAHSNGDPLHAAFFGRMA